MHGMASQVHRSIAGSHEGRSLRRLLLAVSIAPEEIGERIKRAREQKGWSQFEFALEASVSPSTIYRWERGQLPPIRELRRIADLLEISVEEMVAPPESVRVGQDERLRQIEEELATVREVLGRVEEILERREEPPPSEADSA